MATWQGWEQALLNELGAPVTPQNQTFLDSWANAEGGSASYNPMNTTQPAPGSTDYNSVGVKNYPDAATGIAATAKTLQNGYYPDLLAAIKSGNPLANITDSVKQQLNKWGTGSAWLNPTTGVNSDPLHNAGSVFGKVFGGIGSSLPFPFSIFANPADPFGSVGATTGKTFNPLDPKTLIPLSLGVLIFIIGIAIVVSDNKETIITAAAKIPLE